MLTHAQVQRYAAESGLRDIMIAEKEIVLTFLLQLMAERGILEHLAFKGGTCLRKMFAGSQGRFSTDLDFTGIRQHGHEDLILAMMDAFEEPFCGIRFRLPEDGYYEAQGGLSWGIGPVYAHDWNPDGNSEIKLQVSRREVPALSPEKRGQRPQNYFRHLPFAPADIPCLVLEEIIAEKIRACYQRNRARDIYDLGMFAIRPLNQALVRRLAVLKIWQANEVFEPAALMGKFEDGRAFDWDDLKHLVHRDRAVDAGKITADCIRGFGFLMEMTREEQRLANDPYQRERLLWERLRGSLPSA